MARLHLFEQAERSVQLLTVRARLDQQIQRERVRPDLPFFHRLVSLVGNIQSTLGNVQSTMGNVQSTLGNIHSNLGNIQSTLGNVQSTLGNIHSNLGNIQSNLGNIQSNLGNMCREDVHRMPMRPSGMHKTDYYKYTIRKESIHSLSQLYLSKLTHMPLLKSNRLIIMIRNYGQKRVDL
jgi:septation ring formation regulator EzrA